MDEQDKQKSDQQKKHADEKQSEHPGKDVKARTGQQHTGVATDLEDMKDKGYVERIEEKTSKH